MGGQGCGRDVVVGGRDTPVRAAHRASRALEAREGARRALVQQMTVEVEQRLAAGALGHDVTIPDLLEHRLGHGAERSRWHVACASRRPMGRAVRLFTIGRIPIEIHARLLPIDALITGALPFGYFPRALPEPTRATAWTLGLVAALHQFVSVLLHE